MIDFPVRLIKRKIRKTTVVLSWSWCDSDRLSSASWCLHQALNRTYSLAKWLTSISDFDTLTHFYIRIAVSDFVIPLTSSRARDYNNCTVSDDYEVSPLFWQSLWTLWDSAVRQQQLFSIRTCPTAVTIIYEKSCSGAWRSWTSSYHHPSNSRTLSSRRNHFISEAYFFITVHLYCNEQETSSDLISVTNMSLETGVYCTDSSGVISISVSYLILTHSVRDP